MSLRRLAQANHAASTSDSPRSPRELASPLSKYSTPVLPTTPRNRVSIGIYRSPAASPSLSASVPFDWDAARSHAPPPYGTPLQRKARKSMAVNSTGSPKITKRIVRKRSLWERLNDLPSNIAFHLSMFPQNVPLPSAKTSSRLIAGAMHLCNLLLTVSRSRRAPNWEDAYVEEEQDAWWDWTMLLTIILVAVAFANAAYLFSRTRKYHFYRRQDPLNSPNAKFVSKDWDEIRAPTRALWKRILSFSWRAIVMGWCFLLNIPLPSASTSGNANPASKVQELEVWTPGELELQLFSLYSPVHAISWLATGSTNWIMMLFSMGLLTIMLNALIFTYQSLVKDKEIIASEVMHEYNEGFVYPRINPVRHDVGVMTHESEVVTGW